MRVAIVQDLYRIIADINMCTDFELLEVKVPLIFLDMVGFSALRADVKLCFLLPK